MNKKIGNYSFIIGVILAVILGIASNQLGAAEPWLISLLIILGLVVGFLNVAGKETKEFLTVATILVIISYAGSAGQTLGEIVFIGQYIRNIFIQILAFVVPAAIVVALKDVAELAKHP